MDIRQIEAAETLELRRRVMWPELSEAEMVVEGDETAFHYGAFKGVILIGVGSFFPNAGRARLCKLAVDPAHQGQGVAKGLLLAAFEELAAQDIHNVWCDARMSAVGFYQRLGFRIEGTVFQKRGLDYTRASRVL